jgi:hypothetical protein
VNDRMSVSESIIIFFLAFFLNNCKFLQQTFDIMFAVVERKRSTAFGNV